MKNKKNRATGQGAKEKPKKIGNVPASVKKTRAHHGVPAAAAAPAGLKKYFSDGMEISYFEGLPVVPVTKVQSVVASRCGELLAGKGFFRSTVNRRKVVVIDETTLKMEDMDTARFVTESEKHIRWGTRKPKKDEEGNLVKDEAGKTVWQWEVYSPAEKLVKNVLASSFFLDALPDLEAVLDMARPVWAVKEDDPDGDVPTPGTALERWRAKCRKGYMDVVLSRPGYDPLIKCFTAPNLVFDEEMSQAGGLRVLIETFGSFPYRIEEGEEKWREDLTHLMKNRAFSAHVGSVLLIFCGALFRELARPALLYLADKPGAGKTTLAIAAMAPFLKNVPVKALPTEEKEIASTLDTYLDSPGIVFDNCKGFLASQTLEAAITTAGDFYSRAFGGNTRAAQIKGKVPQIVMTGNHLRVSEDMERRVIVCRLKKGASTKYESFDPRDPAFRAKIAGAAWALVKHWALEHDCKLSENKLESFEPVMEVLNGILEANGFLPLRRTEGLREYSKEEYLQYLIEAVALDVTGEKWIKSGDLLDKAEAEDYIHILIKEGTKDKAAALGKQMAPYKEGHSGVAESADGKRKVRYHIERQRERDGMKWLFKVEDIGEEETP